MVFLIMGSVLPGYMFRYQYCLVGGLEAIVFGPIRWCVWSFRPSSPLRLPHLKCLFVCLFVCFVPDYAEKVTSLVLNRSVTEIERVDTEVVLGTWGSKWTACWCDLPEDPRVASSDQVSYATYYTWMAECVSQPARYVDHDRCINPEYHTTFKVLPHLKCLLLLLYLADLMRFRVGAHWLSVVTGRWADGGTVRAQRYCRKCMAYTCMAYMYGFHCFWTHPLVRLVVST